MFKICWIRNLYQEVYDYYYDLSEDKVYCINLANYNKTQFQATPGIISLCGVFATICGTTFAGKITASSTVSLIFLAIITIIIFVSISKAYDKTDKTLFKYIKDNSIGEHLETTKVKALLKQGRIYIYGLTGFGLICFLGAWFGANAVIYNHNQIGIILYVLGIFSFTVFIKMLSPLNLFRLFIRVNKR